MIRYVPYRKPSRIRAIAIFASLVCFSLAAMASIHASWSRAYGSHHIAGWTSYTVHPGDTLSGLAGRFDSADYMWAVVQQIQTKNKLSGSTIRAGQKLWVPLRK